MIRHEAPNDIELPRVRPALDIVLAVVTGTALAAISAGLGTAAARFQDQPFEVGVTNARRSALIGSTFTVVVVVTYLLALGWSVLWVYQTAKSSTAESNPDAWYILLPILVGVGGCLLSYAANALISAISVTLVRSSLLAVVPPT